MTSCSIGGEIQVLGVFSRQGTSITPSAVGTNLQGVHREEDGDTFIPVKVSAVQQLPGKVDYGIFAIA